MLFDCNGHGYDDSTSLELGNVPTACAGINVHSVEQDAELVEKSQKIIWDKCGWSEIDALPGTLQKLLDACCMVPSGYVCKRCEDMLFEAKETPIEIIAGIIIFTIIFTCAFCCLCFLILKALIFGKPKKKRRPPKPGGEGENQQRRRGKDEVDYSNGRGGGEQQ